MGNFFLKLQHNVWYATIIAILAVLSIALLFYELFYPGATARGHQLARKIDLIIAFIFLADFFLGFFFTQGGRGKWNYFKRDWLNLASSIPITNDIVRVLRLLRIFRALRIIRAFMNLRFAEKRRRDNKKIT